jgi:hypothetical protein
MKNEKAWETAMRFSEKWEPKRKKLITSGYFAGLAMLPPMASLGGFTSGGSGG